MHGERAGMHRGCDHQSARKLRAPVRLDDCLVPGYPLGDKPEGEVSALSPIPDGDAEALEFVKDIHRAALHLFGAVKLILTAREGEDDGQKACRRACTHHIERGRPVREIAAAAAYRHPVALLYHFDAERRKAGKQRARILCKRPKSEMHPSAGKRRQQKGAVQDTLGSGDIRLHIVRDKLVYEQIIHG